MRLPNVRKLFVPDPGYLIADIDLDRADLQVVIAEAEDEELRQACAEGVDLHRLNASVLFGTPMAAVTPAQRAFSKAWVHGTNYGGSARTMARAAGCTIAESEKAQTRWFSIHPGIKRWHERVEASLLATRSVTNTFGFRRLYFDRMEGLLPEALAWVPQSTVAIVTNTGLKNIFQRLPEVHLLLQVHDSLVVQYPERLDASLRPRLRDACLVPIPYPTPLTIGVGIKLSSRSWGDCEEVEWEV